MATLKDRNRPIPNGFQFRQPETGWQAPAWASFDAIVRALISHRQGNPYLLRKHRWATDYNSVAFEVDAFNAKIAESHGWTEYVLEANPDPPKFHPPHIGRSGAAFVGGVKRSAAGIKVVAEWLGSGLKPVSKQLAEQRAAVCVTCPLNVKGNWLQKLEAAVADKVKSLLAVKHDLNLSTSKDNDMGSCAACDCALQLKVWCNLDLIKKNTSDETMAKLDPKCWILHETN